MPPHNSDSWKRLVSALAPDVNFAPPASEVELGTAERALGMKLPEPLRELLSEGNGLSARAGSTVIWSSTKIAECNLQFRKSADFRELYMPFDNLIFFADDGGGDQFAYPVHADGNVHRFDIFRWEHETDARSWFAGTLEQFLELRLRRDSSLG